MTRFQRTMSVATTVYIFLIILYVLFDLGFFWSLIADGHMKFRRGSGGRYQYSRIRQLECALFYPDKQYQEIGGRDAWMSEVIRGYWCVSEEDLEEHRRV